MSHAQELINAIQSCQPQRLRAVICQLQGLAQADTSHLKRDDDRRWGKKCYINDRLTGALDLTALHVAAKAFSANTADQRLSKVFDEMVRDLLEAGANPWLEIGVRKKLRDGLGTSSISTGKTVVEVCEGVLPPALQDWIQDHCDARSTHRFNVATHSTTHAREESELAIKRAKAAQTQAQAA